MDSFRFGRKLPMSATATIKHQLLAMMLEDEIRALPSGATFNVDESPACAGLRRLAKLATQTRLGSRAMKS